MRFRASFAGLSPGAVVAKSISISYDSLIITELFFFGETIMDTKIISLLGAALLLVLSSCATVQVYGPHGGPMMHKGMKECMKHHEAQMASVNDALQTVRAAKGSSDANKTREALGKAEQALQGQVDMMKMCHKHMMEMKEMRHGMDKGHCPMEKGCAEGAQCGYGH
jgi:hypothetical protein